MRRWSRGIGMALAVGIGACAGVMPPQRPVTVDPNATFVAREEHAGLALRRLLDGTAGEVVPAGPTSRVLRTGQGDVAWLAVGAQEVTVRGGPAADAPVLGRVVSTWDDQAVRLAIEPAGTPAIRSDVFRSGIGSGQILLSRDAAMAIDLEGAFTSPLRAADGTPVGWLRVRVGATGATAFEGMMPPEVSDAMIAAAVTALQHEVDAIENQLAGTGSGGAP